MQTEANTSPQSSQSGNNPEIVAASQQVESAQRDADWYDRWKDRADVVSVILALAVFAAAALSNRLGAKLNRANKELFTAKEGLNNLQIEKVRGDATKDIENARDEAKERLETETKRVEGEAGKKIEEARAEAGVKVENARAEAAREIGKVQVEVAAQQERAAKAERALLELKTDVAHWRIENHSAVGRRLQRFPGIKMKIEYLDEKNSRDIADQLGGVAFRAGWEPVSLTPHAGMRDRPEGIRMETGGFGLADGDFSFAAALALALELNSQGIDADVWPAFGLPPKTIRVVVGSKPLLASLPEDMKESARKRRERTRERLELQLRLLEESIQQRQKEKP